MTGGPEGRCAQAFTLRVMREELAQRHCSPSWKPSPICSTRMKLLRKAGLQK